MGVTVHTQLTIEQYQLPIPNLIDIRWLHVSRKHSTFQKSNEIRRVRENLPFRASDSQNCYTAGKQEQINSSVERSLSMKARMAALQFSLCQIAPQTLCPPV